MRIVRKKRLKAFLPAAAMLFMLFALGAAAFAGESGQKDKTGATVPSAKPTIQATWVSAVEAADKSGELLLIVFGAQWCGACRSLKTKTLESPDFLNKAGALQVFFADVDLDPKQAKLFQCRALPDLAVLTPELKILSRRQGFLTVEELLEWLSRARLRAEAGVWEGLTSAQKADTNALDEKHVFLRNLGAQDPAVRAEAIALAETQRDAAMPTILDGSGDPVLGVRIGAGEALRRLAPNAPAPDPWVPAEERAKQLETLRAWWKQTEKLPAVGSEGVELDSAETRALAEALRAISSESPVERTAGLSALVRFGTAALPHVREAIGKSATAGDLQALRLLEDIRWAILIPESLEAQARARRDLARGTNEQRQAAAGRLGGGGPAAVPALRELLDDPDALARESSIQALSKVKGREAVSVLTLSLNARDPNQRMIAAQKLGSSKNRAAAAPLASVLNDPDEVVVCTAIAGLEELKAKDQGPALIRCLSDKRWRVRAAAAEVLGKLQINADDELEKLIDDPDPFVVKAALSSLKRKPTNEKLAALLKRMPDAVGAVVGILGFSKEALEIIETLYDEAVPARKVDIVSALTDGKDEYRHDDGSAEEQHWKSLLSKLADDPEPGIREKFTAVLGRHKIRTICAYLPKLLDDADEEVRRSTASLVVKVAAHHWGVGEEYRRRQASDNFGILHKFASVALTNVPGEEPGAQSAAGFLQAGVKVLKKIAQAAGLTDDSTEDADAAGEREEEQEEEDEEKKKGAGMKTAAQRAEEIKKLHAAWHELLAGMVEKEDADLRVVLAYYFTGDGKTGLARMQKTVLASNNPLETIGTMADGQVFGLLLRRLPWPEGKETLEKLGGSASFFTGLLRANRWAGKQARELLAQPERIATAVESAEIEAFALLAEELLGQRTGAAGQTLQLRQNADLINRLASSAKPRARALGIFMLGGLQKPDERIDKALFDDDKWVRRAAVQSVRETVSSLPLREKKLAPILNDKNIVVATWAAAGLLDEALMRHAELNILGQFKYESAYVWNYSSSGEVELLPPALERKPAFLEVLRKRLLEKVEGDEEIPDNDEDEELLAESVFSVLLAQYGDYSGFEKMLDRYKNRLENAPSALLTALVLTKDAKYLGSFKKKLEAADDEWELRKLLKYIQGIPGDEVREMRREINRRLRQVQR